MNEPTLAAVPGILFRTILRLIARLLLIIAGVFLIIGLAISLVCLLLGTFRTPRGKKWQLAADIILLVTELAKERRRVTKTESH